MRLGGCWGGRDALDHNFCLSVPVLTTPPPRSLSWQSHPPPCLLPWLQGFKYITLCWAPNLQAPCACLCLSCRPCSTPPPPTPIPQHDFVSADRIVGRQLLPEVAKLSRFLDDQLDAAEDVMQCCRMGRVSLVTQVKQNGIA